MKKAQTSHHRHGDSASGRHFDALGLLVLGSLALAACVHPRALTINERNIRLEPYDDETTARLAGECKLVTTTRVPLRDDVVKAVTDAFWGSKRECRGIAKNLADNDFFARCIGEHQAQVGQVGVWEWKTVTRGVVPEAGFAYYRRVGNRIVLTRPGYEFRPSWSPFTLSTLEVYYQGRRVGTVEQVATDAHLRIWKCPASRAETMPGELVWVMRPGPVPDLTGPTTLELVQDGQVLFNDESARHVPLSNVVAAHPPAVEFAQQAESEWRSSERRVYTGVGMLGATLAAMGVSIAGIVKKDPRLIAGGIGGTALFFSLGWGFIASADSSGKAAETALMNGVDRYNDDYLRKAPAQH